MEAEENDPSSTLNLYRAALAKRRELQSGESLEWIETDSESVLAFRRPNGWICVSNFGQDDAALPVVVQGAEFVLGSAEFAGDKVPGSATLWFTSVTV